MPNHHTINQSTHIIIQSYINFSDSNTRTYPLLHLDKLKKQIASVKHESRAWLNDDVEKSHDIRKRYIHRMSM